MDLPNYTILRDIEETGMKEDEEVRETSLG